MALLLLTPRVYVVTFEAVLVSAAQDLFQIIGASGKVVVPMRVHISATDTTIPTSQMLELRARYLPATVTNGSGGSSPTPALTDPGLPAASFTSKANSTSKASTNGTAVTVFEGGCHINNGFDDPIEPQTPIASGESWVFELLSTVSGTVHLSGSCWCAEIGA
jgi:hypothetical protein